MPPSTSPAAVLAALESEMATTFHALGKLTAGYDGDPVGSNSGFSASVHHFHHGTQPGTAPSGSSQSRRKLPSPSASIQMH